MKGFLTKLKYNGKIMNFVQFPKMPKFDYFELSFQNKTKETKISECNEKFIYWLFSLHELPMVGLVDFFQ